MKEPLKGFIKTSEAPLKRFLSNDVPFWPKIGTQVFKLNFILKICKKLNAENGHPLPTTKCLFYNINGYINDKEGMHLPT